MRAGEEGRGGDWRKALVTNEEGWGGGALGPTGTQVVGGAVSSLVG